MFNLRTFEQRGAPTGFCRFRLLEKVRVACQLCEQLAPGNQAHVNATLEGTGPTDGLRVQGVVDTELCVDGASNNQNAHLAVERPQLILVGYHSRGPNLASWEALKKSCDGPEATRQ
jgi:hypothetical protein